MFTWTSPQGVEITLPSMKESLTSGMVRKNRTKPDMDFMYSVVEEIVDAENLAKMDALNMNDTEALFKAWQADGGITAGE
jgi:hypothetical protein